MIRNSSVARFYDPESFQAAIRAAQFEVLPTVRGDFRTELIKADFNSVWIQRATKNLPLIYRGAINTDRLTVAFVPDANQPPLRYCGMNLGPDDIVFNGSGPIHLASDSPSRWASMSLPVESLAAAAEAITGREILRPSATRLMRPAPEIMRRLCALHHAAAELAKTDPALLAQEDVVRAFECQLTEMMVRSLAQGEPVRLLAAVLRQRTIIARFEEFLEVRRGQSVYLVDICKAIGVSERTLRAACQEQFGMSPTRYLWLRRMYLARRRLFQAAAKATSVTEVAMANGFWELGRFAAEYRSLFGETPSMTLRRAS